jgi:hypothetical protein
MFQLFTLLSKFVGKVPNFLKVISGNSFRNGETDELRVSLGLFFKHPWLLPEYRILKSQIYLKLKKIPFNVTKRKSKK